MPHKKIDEKLRLALLHTVDQLGTQARVAEELGVDQATVSRWLPGSQGMEIGQCLVFAKMTDTPIGDVLRWARHDPSRYLESNSLPPLSVESQSIADRVRIMGWERARNSIPRRLRPLLDNAVDAVLTSYQKACELTESNR